MNINALNWQYELNWMMNMNMNMIDDWMKHEIVILSTA